jgi:hydrogenase 3 maturation protease
VGNEELGDDGAALIAAADLKKKLGKRRQSRISVILGKETPESCSGRIRRFEPDLVLILDAARAGKKPGSVFLADKKKIAVEEITTHRIPLSLLVDYLEQSIGCKVLILGIEPQSCERGAPLSAPVRKAATLLASELFAMLS